MRKTAFKWVINGFFKEKTVSKTTGLKGIYFCGTKAVIFKNLQV
jgi:hypothetical protein